MDRGTADADGNVRSTATKKTSILPLRIYKELPVVPLAEFKHPDFPSEEMLTVSVLVRQRRLVTKLFLVLRVVLL